MSVHMYLHMLVEAALLENSFYHLNYLVVNVDDLLGGVVK